MRTTNEKVSTDIPVNLRKKSTEVFVAGERLNKDKAE